MMPAAKMIIFDLDGTLNDSSPGMIHCFLKTAEEMGISGVTEEDARTGLSGPFEKNIAKILGIGGDDVMKGIKIYIKHYLADGQKKSVLFPGVKDVLMKLKEEGYLLGIATMMVEDFAKATIESYGLSNVFSSIRGTNLTTPLTKGDLVDLCLYDTGVSKDNAVLVGDGIDDYNASVECGIGFIGATYGYELTEEFCKNKGIRHIEEPIGLLSALSQRF